MDSIIDFLILYENIKYINIFFQTIGTIYVLLILLRGFLMAFVAITKTDKDNKIVSSIYSFIDKYSLSLEKTKKFSKLQETKQK